jgi:phosphate uptake regulator
VVKHAKEKKMKNVVQLLGNFKKEDLLQFLDHTRFELFSKVKKCTVHLKLPRDIYSSFEDDEQSKTSHKRIKELSKEINNFITERMILYRMVEKELRTLAGFSSPRKHDEL